LTIAGWRRAIALILAIGLCTTLVFAVRWVWRDITYWSRSTTVAYQADSLEQCVRMAVADLPGVSVIASGPAIQLQVPAQEGALVKGTPEPRVARIVVYGHSNSVSRLGPASEEAVTELLQQLRQAISARCGSLTA
jgi:hypothetical protein